MMRKLIVKACILTCMSFLICSNSVRADILEAYFDYFDESAFFWIDADNDGNAPRIAFSYYVPLKSLKMPKRKLRGLIKTLNETYDSDAFSDRDIIRELQKKANLRFEIHRGADIVAVCKAPNRYLQITSNYNDEGEEEWALETTYIAQLPIENPRDFEREICVDPITKEALIPVLQEEDRAIFIQRKSIILAEEEFIQCSGSGCDNAFE